MMQALRQRIRDAYEAKWKAEKHFNEEAILQELPTSLRIEVRDEMASPRILILTLSTPTNQAFVSLL
jgi:hypothetical protein